jgi:hypothetical protein
MTENRISASLTQEDIEAIMSAISIIKAKLPFLIDLTPEEAKSLSRMGDKSRAFVSKSLELATQNPKILPGYFDLEEMKQDLELFEALYPIAMALSQLSKLVDDTTTIAGSESYSAARLIYSYAKVSDLSAGLEPLIDDLGKRFKKSKKPTQDV